jgi:predicted O-linked N-acetylglucosamine transferase (SPINDLY family)/precorrin-6B methylase 2
MTQHRSPPVAGKDVLLARELAHLLEQGIAHHRQGELAAAAQLYHAVLQRSPQSADALNLLGHIAKSRGEFATARDYYLRAIAIAPQEASFHYSLAVIYHERGELQSAASAYEAALRQQPQHAMALENLAVLRSKQGHRGEALTLLRKAAEQPGTSAQLFANLAELLRASGDLSGALAAAEKAVTLNPSSPLAHSNLATITYRLGDAARARAHIQRALQLDPSNAKAHSSLLHCMHYLPDYSPADSAAAHREWATRHAGQARAAAAPRRRLQGSKLRIGYISPDLRKHSVSYFLEPILAQHDRKRFAIYAYANVEHLDQVSERLKRHFDGWRDIYGVDAAQAAQRIREDQIDILVDLAGHSRGNRLDVLALQAAPIQVTYLGYPDTTGLSNIAYRLTDAWSDPPGAADALYSEKLLRLPDCFLCYQPSTDSPRVAPLPALRNGAITFGSFNNLAKITSDMLDSWSTILRGLPSSRLLIKALALDYPEARRRIEQHFRSAGIDLARIRMHGRIDDTGGFLQLYNEVDIALDTFPYNGTTTTCDALWMGVPVITLAGHSHVSRVGVSLLSTVGLIQCIASDSADYCNKALTLAADLNKLATLRTDLRERMARSPLTDAATFTRRLEESYQMMIDGSSTQQDDRNPPAAAGRSSADAATPLRVVLSESLTLNVPDDIDNLTGYVLSEQRTWIEPEAAFLPRYLRAGMRYVDIGAGYGQYTLSAAQHVGARGEVLAFERDDARRALLLSSAKANGLRQVLAPVVAQPDAGAASLAQSVAAWAATADAGADLIRVDAELPIADFIAAAGAVLQRQPSLVMAFVRRDGENLPQLAQQFAALGYGAYRLVPGLNQLTDLDSENADPFMLNAFFCAEPLAARLRADGVIASLAADAAGVEQTIDANLWADHLLQRPFAAPHAARWQRLCSGTSNLAGWEHYRDALSAFVAAHALSTPSGQRLPWLAFAFSQLTHAVAAHANLARLQTLARIAHEIGLRQTAVVALEAALQLFASDTALTWDEPFLPVCLEDEALPSGESPGTWCLRSIAVQHERLARISSFFGDAELLGHYQFLREIGVVAAEFARREALLGARLQQDGDRRISVALQQFAG